MAGNTSARDIRPADPCCFVIFGASGDLTHRLLMPALYNLSAAGALPDDFSLIGVARTEMSDDAFRTDLQDSLRKFATRQVDSATADKLLACTTYLQGTAEDPRTYQALGDKLQRIERTRTTRGNRLFYLATPPAGFAPIGCNLGESGLAREEDGAWRRVIIEKPFGTDLAFAGNTGAEPGGGAAQCRAGAIHGRIYRQRSRGGLSQDKGRQA